MNQTARRPDIEFIKKNKDGSCTSYGHIYWKPFIVHLFGKTMTLLQYLKLRWGIFNGDICPKCHGKMTPRGYEGNVKCLKCK